MSAHIAPPPHHRLYHPRLCLGRRLVSPLPLCVTCTELLKWSSKDTISSSGSLLKHPVISGEQPDLLRGPQSPSGHAACCHPGPNVPSLAACPHTLLSSDRLGPLPASGLRHVLCPRTTSAPSRSFTRPCLHNVDLTFGSQPKCHVSTADSLRPFLSPPASKLESHLVSSHIA